MSSTEVGSERTTNSQSGDDRHEARGRPDPVTDVDRAKRLCRTLGWRLDADFAVSDDFRLVELTPPDDRNRR
jgi:hypothetical protein